MGRTFRLHWVFLTAVIMCGTQCKAKSKMKMIKERDSLKRQDIKAIKELNCSVWLQSPDMREMIETLIKDENKQMLRFSLTFLGGIGKLRENIPGNLIYRPEEWILVNEVGEHLLMLSEDFVPRSMNSLSFSVSDLPAIIEQTNGNCSLTIDDVNDIENIIRFNILTNFSTQGYQIPETYELCNRHIKETGDLIYVCCHINNQGKSYNDIECRTLKQFVWIDIFNIFLKVLQYVVALFCPLAIPLSLFERRSEILYICKFQGQALTLKLKIPEEEKELPIEQIKLRTQHKRLIPEGSSPYGLFHFIWTYCILLNIHKSDKSSSLPRVIYYCRVIYTRIVIVTLLLTPQIIILAFYFKYDQNIIEYNEHLFKDRKLDNRIETSINSPYTFETPFEIVLCVLTFVGYLFLEYFRRDDKVNFANVVSKIVSKCLKNVYKPIYNDKKIKEYYDNNGILQCIGYFCFSIFPLTKLALFLLLKFLKTLTSSNSKDENDENKDKGSKVGTFLAIFVWFPCCIFFFVRSVLIIAVFYVKTLVYAILGLILNYDDVFKYVCIALLVLTYGYQAFNAVRLKHIKFRIILGNVIMKMIKNARKRVNKDLDALVKDIESDRDRQQIYGVDNNEEQCDIQVTLCKKEQCDKQKAVKNFAYSIHGLVKLASRDAEKRIPETLSHSAETPNSYTSSHSAETPNLHNLETNTLSHSVETCKMLNNELFMVDESHLQWEALGLILFVDINGEHIIQNIPKKFYDEMSNLPHKVCPGYPTNLYIKATIGFLKVVIVLVSIVIFVLALGEGNNMSSGVQTLVGLGGGFLPFFFKAFVFETHSSELDGLRDELFEQMVIKKIESYKEKWDVELIVFKDEEKEVTVAVKKTMGIINQNYPRSNDYGTYEISVKKQQGQ